MSSRKTPLPEPFLITDEMRDWADEKMPMVDIDSATEEFCDYWRGNGRRMCDWTATWRNWIRRTPYFSRPRELPISQIRGRIEKPMLVRDHPLLKLVRK